MKTHAVTGAAAGVPLALLINRYLLGNKSLTSNIVASLLGGGAGSLAGIGLYNWRKGQALKEHQVNLQQLDEHIKAERDKNTKLAAAVGKFVSNPDLDLDDPEQLAALKGVYAQYGKELQDSDINSFKAFAEIQNIDKSLRNPYYGVDVPLIPIAAETEELLREHSKFFQDNSAAGRFDELNFGGLRTVGEQGDVFQQILHSNIGTSLPPAHRNFRLASLMNYHDKLHEIAISKKFNSLPKSLQTPEIADYMALQAIQPEQRRFIPVMHRLTAAARAKASKGWSYVVDRDMYRDPKYLRQALAVPSLQRQATDFSRAMFSVGTKGKPILNFFLPILGEGSVALPGFTASRTLPDYRAAFQTANGDTWGTRNYRNAVINKLFSPESGVPIYSWAYPEISKLRKLEQGWSTVADLMDIGVDAGDAYKTLKNWSTLSKASRAATVAGQAVNWGLHGAMDVALPIMNIKDIQQLSSPEFQQAHTGAGVTKYQGNNVMNKLGKSIVNSVFRKYNIPTQ